MRSARSAAESRIGTVLKGKWRIDSILGTGGMSTVYAATHRNGHRAAVKVLLPAASTSEAIVMRFMREAYVANKIGHPSVPAVIDDDVAEDGAAFLVMELLEGETLGARRRNAGGRLSPEEVLEVGDKVLDVLAAAHAHGVVHRDIKPENIFRTNDGTIKVLDFGIAGLRDAANASLGEGITRTGHLMGTHGYMSPEQARCRWAEVDAQSDLFSLGATLFVLLAGRKLHEAETPNEFLLKEMTEPAPASLSLAPDIPPPVASLIDRAVAFAKPERWADAEEMKTALADAREGRMPGKPSGRQSRATLVEPAVSSVPSSAVVAVMATSGQSDDGSLHASVTTSMRKSRKGTLTTVFALCIAALGGAALFWTFTSTTPAGAGNGTDAPTTASAPIHDVASISPSTSPTTAPSPSAAPTVANASSAEPAQPSADPRAAQNKAKARGGARSSAPPRPTSTSLLDSRKW